MQITYKAANNSKTPFVVANSSFSALAALARPLLFDVGQLESYVLRRQLEKIPVQSPVYIMGLARAGTTILLEVLASCTGVASHRYQDFPWIPVPYTWRNFVKRFSKSDSLPRERSHRDGLAVTSASPEAFEEMLWMHFFPECYSAKNVLGLNGDTRNEAFERFYHNHMRKLMLSEKANRYVAKGNNNLIRLSYLQRLYPGARFVIAIREPRAHIASLIKQQRLFCKLEQEDPRLLTYMQAVGHFEFGLDRRTLHMPGETASPEIHAAWDAGEEVKGWALYWHRLYASLWVLLKQNPALAANTLIVKYEALCDASAETLDMLYRHCSLPAHPEWGARLHAPDYYAADYTNEEQDIISKITSETAGLFGY